jgi:MFS family permease
MSPTASDDESQPAYRKRTVWMLAIAETIVWAGMFYLFPALLPHWEQDLGWAKTELAAAFTCALIVSALAAPFAGRLIDRGHGRKVLTISAFCGGLLLVLLSRVHELWQFYAVWLGLGLMMSSCLYEACFAYLTHKLGAAARRAITLITLVAGFAGTVSFPTSHFLAEAFSWRGSALFFALLICTIAAPLMWFSEPRSDSAGAAATVARAPLATCTAQRALRSPVFWLLALAFAMISLDHGMLITHLLPLLGERGVHQEIAVLAVSMIGPMQVAGRLLMMAVERRVSMPAVCATTFIFISSAAIVLYFAGASTMLILTFVLLQGSGYGVTSITRPVITAAYLGRVGFGTISGMQAMAFMGATAIAPMLAALIWAAGGYYLMIIICIVLALIGLIAFSAAARLVAEPI